MSAGWELVAGDTGGTVGGLALARTDGRTCVYAATAVGVYRSEDGGRTWALAGSRNSVPFAEVVVPSGRFEQDRTIFVCAGEALYRSSDAGEAWQQVLVGGRMLSVASADADGHEGPVVVAGTEADGVLRSEDGGRSWAGANAGLLDLTALALVVSPEFASDRLGFAGTASGLYRTRNGARSWREVETGLSDPAVQCVAISPAFAEDRLVLAGTEADGLLRSDDGGATWHRPASLVDDGITAVAFSSSYASTPTVVAATGSGVAVSSDGGRTWQRSGAPGVVLSLVFVPTGDGEVLLAGLHRHGVARSDDEGATWQPSNAGLSARLLTSLVVSPAFAQDRILFTAGPQDGLEVSSDGGVSWAEGHAGLEDAAVLALAVSPAFTRDHTLYAATPSGIHVSRDAGKHWAYAGTLTATARTVATQPQQPAQPAEQGAPGSAPVPAAATPPSAARWSGAPGSVAGPAAASSASASAAAAAGPAARDPATGTPGSTPAAAGPAATDPATGTPASAAAAAGQAAKDPATGTPGSAAAVASPAAKDPATGTPASAAAMGSARGSVPAPPVAGVGAWAGEPTPTVVAALSGGGLMASHDGGTTWRSLGALVEDAEILHVAMSPDYARDRTMFVATSVSAEMVVWRSVDGGQQWERWLVESFTDGQPFMSLAIAPTYATDEVLFAGVGARVFSPVRNAHEVRAGKRRPVWHAADLGAGAVSITAVIPTPTFAEDRTVFASTNAGVFVSRDGGHTFQAYSEGLVPPGVVALALSPAYRQDRLIYALGLGGTLWRRHDDHL